jgi:Domain of unknown function (DUF202)
MIRGYSDHAANERTFLAWLRTSIAVIAFGFVSRNSICLRSPCSIHHRSMRLTGCGLSGCLARCRKALGVPSSRRGRHHRARHHSFRAHRVAA